MEYLEILEKGIWFGFGALGFAILFNVPPRTLLIIWVLGAIGGLLKLFSMQFGLSVITGTLLGASTVGLLSILAAYNKSAPPLVFSTPAVIPLIPGVFIYKTMIGIMKLSGNIDNATYMQVLSETINYGTKAVFILLCISVGVSLPILIFKGAGKKATKLQYE